MDKVLQLEQEVAVLKNHLEFMSIYDALTGLYNRAYFEQKLGEMVEESDVGLILCDFDGLRLVNETLGYEAGNKAIKKVGCLLQECIPGGLVCSIGHGEFAVILQDITLEELDRITCSILRNVENYNKKNVDIPLSISLGYSKSRGIPWQVGGLIREAEELLYRQKLHSKTSRAKDTIHLTMSMLGERDYITEGHAERLQDLVGIMGEYLNLTAPNKADLSLLAVFHDIGKIGIPDHILFKPGPLTVQEYRRMQHHCEIGQRIALASPCLAHIADYILKHHEWWNGEGYPLRLAKEEIPLLCRILSIADAYDAMTNDRPYRKALTKEAAIEEIKKGAGKQFDPNLVEVFMEIAGNYI